MKESNTKSYNEMTSIYYSNEGYCIYDDIFSVTNIESDGFFALGILL